MKFPPDPPFVLFEDSRSRSSPKAGLLFEKPLKVIECSRLEGIGEALEDITKAQGKGHFLAGWMSYEAGYHFHPTLRDSKITLAPEPLIWMGVFEKPQSLSAKTLREIFTNFQKRKAKAGLKTAPDPCEDEKVFGDVFKKIMAYIRAGDIYQVNHTFPLRLDTFGPPLNLYARLREAQPVPYSGFIDTGNWRVLSFSPELFIARRGRALTSRPMKGTAKPGRTLEESRQLMKKLKGDEKNRAENLMITDMIRNDFSRVCEPGTVKVPKLFEVERFQTVLQMSSEVRGTLKKEVDFLSILKAVFPCGSITGAPKIRAMEIIHETEPEPRGVYTGALGFVCPNGDFKFNVPIRTAILNKQGKGRLGIGSGLVAQSNFKTEYRECLLKAKFLGRGQGDFSLIETMLWSPDEGLKYLEAHLKRLKSSARYFNFQFPEKRLKNKINHFIENLPKSTPRKVRLTLGRAGTVVLEAEDYDPKIKNKPQKITLSEKRVDSKNPFLFHKTTKRLLYREEFKHAREGGFYDVIFLNEKGNITEGTFNNIFVQGNRNQLFTPDLGSGLLPGILRQNLLNKGLVKETSLTCEDLKKAPRILVGNSVSGLVEVSLIGNS